MPVKTIILADGTFPVHKIPLGILRDAEKIICCDGSAGNLLNAGFVPDAIVGDMDSVSSEVSERFADRVYVDSDQETNDLTKAVKWCRESGLDDITILGATGKREDHTIGNISLLADYSEMLSIRMVTDYGVFLPFHRSCRVETYPGQQVSVFSIQPSTEISSSGLRYPLVKRTLSNWWQATLNEAEGNSFELTFEGSPVLVFLKFRE